ncbi:MAG: hypothetical protein ACI8RD_013794 [Bacillariaceae sp.]|jgi:hypothetical protein
MRNVKEDPIEKVAMLSLFESCNTICCLGFGDYDVNYSDIEYALSINHAGRRIVESGGRKEGRKVVVHLFLFHYGLLYWKERIKNLVTYTLHGQLKEKPRMPQVLVI